MGLLSVHGNASRLLQVLVTLCLLTFPCSALWRSIRIEPLYYNLNKTLDAEQIAWLQSDVRLSIARVQELLEVFSYSNDSSPSLVLPRSEYCQMEDASSGKCMALLDGYKSNGQMCSSSSDVVNIQISDSHLEELVTYDKRGNATVHIPRGKGVANADMVVYVTAFPTGDCLSTSKVNAYSNSCDVISADTDMSRPLAGYINLCPHFVSSANKESGKLLATVIHELIHVLGFSTDLFRKFMLCKTEGDARVCRPYQLGEFSVSRDKYMFIKSPSVLRFAQEHFNCSSGIPLQLKNGFHTSHWHEVFMYSSIMQPYIGDASGLFLDAGSLALLEDSGWYRANYSQADRFVWGENLGCDFFTSCASSDFFCDPKASSSLQCDVFHKSVGNCSSISGTSCSVVQGSSSCGTEKSERCFSVQKNDIKRSFVSTSMSSSHPACFNVTCSPASKSYFLTSSQHGQVNCSSGSTSIALPDASSLACVPYNRICPLTSSVYDLMFLEDRYTTSTTTTSTSTSPSTTSTSSLSSTFSASSSVHPTSSTEPPFVSSSASTLSPSPATTLSFLLFRAFIGIAAFASDNLGSPRPDTTTIRPRTSPRPHPPSAPAKKFEVTFGNMDFYQMQRQNLLNDLKEKVRLKLAQSVFEIEPDRIKILDVFAGSVVVVFEINDYPISQEEAMNKLKMRMSAIHITVGGTTYAATSVDYAGDESNRKRQEFPLTEIIVGSVVGGLLLIGLVVVVALTISKQKLRHVRQVRPGTSSPASSNASREASALPPSSARQTVGLAENKSLGLTDVEATGVQRGISAGSIEIGLALPPQSLYFEETL